MKSSSRLSQLLIAAGLPLLVSPAVGVPSDAPSTAAHATASPDLIRAASKGDLKKVQILLDNSTAVCYNGGNKRFKIIYL